MKNEDNWKERDRNIKLLQKKKQQQDIKQNKENQKNKSFLST